MEYKELIELIRTVSDSNISDFQYEQGDTKIVMSSSEASERQAEEMILSAQETREECTQNETEEEKAEDPGQENGKGNLVTSPLVGTFYASPAEGEEPFVKVGDEVKAGQPLAIVEAMKLMNEIVSDYEGVISEVYVENGELVEFGQPLFEVKTC